MWIITEDGFFNIVQYEEDRERDFLTLKARRRADLVAAGADIYPAKPPKMYIEESEDADYKFRMKAPRKKVMSYVASYVGTIDYPKTKDALHAAHPDRDKIYLAVWDTLSELQK
jgi:N-methylhydantoinase A/oxoprolinase/acetone carboxylase beta subunit